MAARELGATWRAYASSIREGREPGIPAQAAMLDVCAGQLEDELTREADLSPNDVHCDTCGAAPGDQCLTPSGAPTTHHRDRRANAQVIARHMRVSR